MDLSEWSAYDFGMKTLTLVNDRSGTAEQVRSRLETLARLSDSQLLHFDRDHPIKDLVERGALRDCDRLIIVGGDGTISTVLNGIKSHLADFEYAIIPAGTGNDLARSVGVSADSIDAAWELAISGEAEPIDIVQVSCGETSFFVNAATAGFGGKVAVDVDPEDKRRWGAFAYWLTAVSNLLDLEEFQIELELEDRTVILPVYGVGVTNGRYVGGGFPLSPTAYVNDGLLNVTTIPVLPAMELIAAGLQFVLMREEDEHGVRTFQSSRVRIRAVPALPFSIDGEPAQTLDSTFHVIPGAVRMVCSGEAPAVRHQSTDERPSF